VNTNGILLAEKADDLIGNIDTLTLSIIEKDEPGNVEQQRKNLAEFLKLKGDKRPNVVLRFLGNVERRPWNFFNLLQATRVLHSCNGSFDYKQQVTIPEMGICLDVLTGIAIDRTGKVFPCVRFNPDGLSQIGDLNSASLDEVVNSIESHHWQKGKHLRKRYVQLHVQGRRNEIDLCARGPCQYYGCPVGNSK
jgi:hypothetical protein